MTSYSTLALGLDSWADDGSRTELDFIRWAAAAAAQLADGLRRLQVAAEARWEWDQPGRPFAASDGGKRLHARNCWYVDRLADGHRPLTAEQAGAYLRRSREHLRCAVCQPDIAEPVWVQVRPANGQARWRLAEDVQLPGDRGAR